MHAYTHARTQGFMKKNEVLANELAEAEEDIHLLREELSAAEVLRLVSSSHLLTSSSTSPCPQAPPPPAFVPTFACPDKPCRAPR